VVLIISLILLLILTVLGVGAMDNTLLGLKMTGSFQRQMQALSDSERNLMLAERDVEEIVESPGRFDFSSDGDGYYDSTTAVKDVLDWQGLNANTVSGGDFTHEYIVEYLGRKRLPGESLAESPDGGIPGNSAFAYIVTARSQVAKGAVRTVQSAYTTYEQP
jgi:hypothetical protein